MNPASTKTQRARILRLLMDAHGAWVPLPEILALGIAQYNARIFDLRRLGFDVENKTETDPETGVRHSWFRLVKSSPQTAPTPVQPITDFMRRRREEREQLAPLFAGTNQ